MLIAPKVPAVMKKTLVIEVPVYAKNIDDRDNPISAAKIQKTVCALEALIFAIFGPYNRNGLRLVVRAGDQNENETTNTRFVSGPGPHNRNGLCLVLQEKVTKTNLVL